MIRALRRAIAAMSLAAALVLLPVLVHAERPFRVYRALEAQAEVDLPPKRKKPKLGFDGYMRRPTTNSPGTW